MNELLNGRNIDDVDVLAIAKGIAFDRKGMEGDVPTSKRLRLWQEAQDIPATINHDIVLRNGEQILQFTNVAEETLGSKFCNHASDESLLAMGTV